MKHLASFAGRLKAARLAMFERFGAEMSQTDLAGRVGVRRATVSGWEGGAFEPPQPTKEELADILRVSPAWLILNVGDRYPASGEDVSRSVAKVKPHIKQEPARPAAKKRRPKRA